MKKTSLVSILLISLMAITIPVGYAGEPPPCSNGYALIGPPVVGTVVIKYLSGTDPYYLLSYVFKGCCADCFQGSSGGSCSKATIQFEKTLNILPEDFLPEYIQNYNVIGFGPKRCYSKNGGEDLVVTEILKFDNTTDIDGDGKIEAVADIVMFYWQCNP
jgi:hypothetical protein